jgi:GT2 family glycosyltransferase
VLNYGYHSFVAECLKSVCLNGEREIGEVILVDSGSKAADREALISEINKHNIQIDKFVWLERNLGFGAGMNAGIRQAEGDLIVALNSDVVVAKEFYKCVSRMFPWPPDTGFIALRVNHMKAMDNGWEYSDQTQAEAVSLTSYCSCYPIKLSDVNPSYILGPPGCIVAMTRQLIKALHQEKGFVYDPHFFLYGEDVDLFLRTKRLGYKTIFVKENDSNACIAWHIGSGSTAGGNSETLRKSPEMVRNILDGMWDNALLYSGRVELPIIVILQLLFRIIFYFKYIVANSIEASWKLFCLSRRPRRKASKINRPLGFWLLRNMGCIYRRPFPWAR